MNILYKILVDLDDIEGQCPDAAEGGISRSEIIQRKPDSKILNIQKESAWVLARSLMARRSVSSSMIFSGFDVILFYAGPYNINDIRLHDLYHGEIYAYGILSGTCLFHSLQHSQALRRDVVSNGIDKSQVLGQRHKVIGTKEAQSFAVPILQGPQRPHGGSPFLPFLPFLPSSLLDNRLEEYLEFLRTAS